MNGKRIFVHQLLSKNITKGATMIYRVDKFTENNINPITNTEYDESWLVLTLSNNITEPMIVGANNDSTYIIKINKALNSNWKMAVGDFIDYCNDNNLNGILAITENEYTEIKNYYFGHSFIEPFLRDYETPVLIHSTSMENWIQIQKDGMLKSWNKLNSEKSVIENEQGHRVVCR